MAGRVSKLRKAWGVRNKYLRTGKNKNEKERMRIKSIRHGRLKKELGISRWYKLEGIRQLSLNKTI
jgi:hypothetical protein